MAVTGARPFPRGSDGRRPPSPGAQRLARAVAARSREASERWLEALDRHPSVPRSRVFPGDPILDDVHVLVAWITGPDRGRIPEAVSGVLRALVDLREGQGRFVGDLYRELHLLSRTLHEVLEEEARAAAGEVEPGDVAVEASRISHGLLTAVGVAADIFDERQRSDRDDDRNAFASVVRHEMRNPLGAAQAAAQLLREDGDELGPERFDRVLGSLERSVRHALDVLASVTSLEHDRGPGEVERWEPLHDVLGRVVAMARDRAGEDADVRLEAVPDLLVDGDRVGILAHNLVENAVKYRKPGEPCRIQVEVERDEPGGVWWVRVRDNGVGIAAEEQERIFQRFYRADEGDVEGTGLGLSIAREAARQMGAVLEVESAPGQGSVFSVCIPDDRTRTAG